MFIATVENKGQTFYLRGTTWAFHRERADVFASFEQAAKAIEKAGNFMPFKLYKKIKLENA